MIGFELGVVVGVAVTLFARWRVLSSEFVQESSMMVVDRNGIPILPQQLVLVHQDEGTREAVVVEPFSDAPTVKEPGHWVDVDIDNAGPEALPSYLLEVIPA